MSSNSGIYKITSPSGKIYIGETVNFEKRFKRYNRLECKRQFKLYNSFLKYGVENHIFEIIEECDITELKCRERYWQDYYDVISEKGLNLLLSSCEDKKQIINQEVIDKMISTKRDKGHFLSENNPMYGKKHSEETKDKIRKAQLGKYNGNKNPMYGKFGNKHPAYGNKRSTEQLQKARENNLFGNNPRAKTVIDVETGIYYYSASEVAHIWGINKYTLRRKLNNTLVNNTNFKYC